MTKKTERKLRIAVFVTSEMPFPFPKDYDRPYAPLTFALELAERLHEQGHEIVFFGPKGSKSSTFTCFESDLISLYRDKKLKQIWLREEGKEKIHRIADQYIVDALFDEHRKKPFDVIHIHSSPDRAIHFARHYKNVEIVYTLHTVTLPWLAAAFDTFGSANQHIVSVSNAQRLQAPTITYRNTIYNGINTKHFAFSKKKGDYLLFAGRPHAAKGVAEAVKVAFQTKEKLLIVGSPISDEPWWEREIKPFLSEHIQYIGYVPREKMVSYYQNAKALLVPLLWEEPFGLVMIEAMSCGTPIIAFNKGSAKEIVEDGKTGFVVETTNEMARTVKKISEIKREDCRKHVEKNFTLELTASRYEELFREITKK